MFTWLNKQGVRSHRGFELQFTGRYSAEYKEFGKSAELYLENNGSTKIYVYVSSFEKLVGRMMESGKILEEERKRIYSNLSEAMNFQGLELELVSDP